MNLLRCDSVLLDELFSVKGCGAFIFSASYCLTYLGRLEVLVMALFNLVSSEGCVVHSIRHYCCVGMQLGGHNLSASISYVQ